MTPTSPVRSPTTTMVPHGAASDGSATARSVGGSSRLPQGSGEIQSRSSSEASIGDKTPSLLAPRNPNPAQRFREVAMQTMNSQQRAQVSWSRVAANLPEMVKQRNAERAFRLTVAQAMFNTGELKMPRAFEGKVTRMPDGMLASDDKAVASILRFAQAQDPEAFRDLPISDDTTLALPLDPNVLLQTQLFANGCSVYKLDLSDGTSSKVNKIDLTTFTTREAIKKSARGFENNAELAFHDPDGGPAPVLPGNGLHPFAFLTEVRFQAQSSSPELQRAIEACMNKNDPTTLELRGRLGAQAVKSVLSQKEVTKEHWIALGLSLALAGGVAVALDVFAWGEVHKEMAHRYGEDDPRTILADIILASLTSAIAEGADSFTVGRLMEKLRGGSFMPESLSDAWDTLKNSMKAGGISALGAVGNNALELTKKWAFQPLNFFTNQIAVSTSGAMVPLEVAGTHENMTAGVIQQMNKGFFPTPELPAVGGPSHGQSSAGMTESELAKAEKKQAKDFARQVKGATEPALNVAPGDGLAINSMGIGSLVSQLAFLPVDASWRAGKLKPVVKSIVQIITNTPTEVISTTIGSVTGRSLGMGKKITTDAEKDRLVMELIVSKALQRLEAPNPNDPSASAEITEAELQAIEHPDLELTFKAGRVITKLMNGGVDMMAKIGGALRGRPPESLGEQVDISQLRRQAPEAFPAEV